MSNINEMLGTITEFLKNEVQTQTLVGKEFKLGEYTCVPVIAVGMGFGAGGGNGKDPKSSLGEGSAAGAGIGMSAIGFLASRGAEIQFISTKTSKGISAAIEKVPDLLEKYMETSGKDKKAETEK
jgi:uncharacterized spore protein YtfJ